MPVQRPLPAFFSETESEITVTMSAAERTSSMRVCGNFNVVSSRSYAVLILALLVLWWPSRVVGPLDGVPFDSAADAIVLGLALPALCWLVPSFLHDRRAQAMLLSLFAWKVLATTTLVQDGWCARVEPSRPYVKDGTGAPHSWDVRADWLSADPACSAITTRAYLHHDEFPVWFFNLPAANGDTPHPGDWPPEATTRLTLKGYVFIKEAGALRLWTSPDVATRTSIDGERVANDGVTLTPGSHAIAIDAILTGDRWVLAPLWNDTDMWTKVIATVAPMSSIDRAVRPWGRWVSLVLVTALVVLAGWHLYTFVDDRWVVAWTVGASAIGALVAAVVPGRWWHFAAVLMLAVCALPVPDRLKNIRGAFVLIGIPWLVVDVVDNVYEQGFGRMTFYAPGNDFWEFQRWAYRIFLQGYWLEGGEPTFWFQPMYRWIAGALHVLFGDSSVGEDYWDGVGILVMALFAFQVVRAFAGFRWGLAAAVMTFVTFIAGPGYIFIGRGLSEISSAGFIYLAALCVIHARGRSIPLLFAAGALATFGVWTRLNNLPMALGVAAFAWPLSEPIATLWRPRSWFADAWKPALVVVPACLVLGMTLFALRTWHYTGTFTGMQEKQMRTLATWQPGMSIADGVSSSLSSLMMVLTTSDPPKYHNGSVPLMAGAALSVAALTGVGALGRLPLAPVLFTLSALVGSLAARGVAYTGRFSIHVVGATVAVLMCAVSLLQSRFLRPRTDAASR